jgi:hypothetical protein
LGGFALPSLLYRQEAQERFSLLDA